MKAGGTRGRDGQGEARLAEFERRVHLLADHCAQTLVVEGTCWSRQAAVAEAKVAATARIGAEVERRLDAGAMTTAARIEALKALRADGYDPLADRRRERAATLAREADAGRGGAWTPSAPLPADVAAQSDGIVDALWERVEDEDAMTAFRKAFLRLVAKALAKAAIDVAWSDPAIATALSFDNKRSDFGIHRLGAGDARADARSILHALRSMAEDGDTGPGTVRREARARLQALWDGWMAAIGACHARIAAGLGAEVSLPRGRPGLPEDLHGFASSLGSGLYDALEAGDAAKLARAHWAGVRRALELAGARVPEEGSAADAAALDAFSAALGHAADSRVGVEDAVLGALEAAWAGHRAETTGTGGGPTTRARR